MNYNSSVENVVCQNMVHFQNRSVMFHHLKKVNFLEKIICNLPDNKARSSVKVGKRKIGNQVPRTFI